MYKLLLTCPQMINTYNKYSNFFDKNNILVTIPNNFIQTLSEFQLINIIKDFDIWIVGDDPVTENILLVASNLKLIIKWGVGIDNVDTFACKKYNINFYNTPGMFSEEVSDVAVGYLIMLARDLHNINAKVHLNSWYKSEGMSLVDKTVALVGYGNIGKALTRKLLEFKMRIKIFDPLYNSSNNFKNLMFFENIKNTIKNSDFIIITCSLNNNTYHLINHDLIKCANHGVYIINVSRGQIICEKDLIDCLDNGFVKGAALDVFEKEPLECDNKLRQYNCIFGSHNASNTKEAVERTNNKVIKYIEEYINITKH